jgi:ABC-type branched-subunit amino acid transport system ATPase component
MSLLRVEEITKGYGGLRALNHFSMNVEKGIIKGLIGPNGAGKSTLFHLISGIEKPDSGKIYFKDKEITALESHEISALGIARTFQTVQTLSNMTAIENIMAGMHLRLKGNLLSSGFWLPWTGRAEKGALKEAKEILDLLGLLGRWKSPASQLPLGKQKLLELGRALAMKPELVLLDEPASGLTSAEGDELKERIHQFKRDGMTFCIVEHQMGMVMEIADQVAVLDSGRLIAEGPPAIVERNAQVMDAYLKRKRSDA